MGLADAREWGTGAALARTPGGQPAPHEQKNDSPREAIQRYEDKRDLGDLLKQMVGERP